MSLLPPVFMIASRLPYELPDGGLRSLLFSPIPGPPPERGEVVVGSPRGRGERSSYKAFSLHYIITRDGPSLAPSTVFPNGPGKPAATGIPPSGQAQ